MFSLHEILNYLGKTGIPTLDVIWLLNNEISAWIHSDLASIISQYMIDDHTLKKPFWTRCANTTRNSKCMWRNLDTISSIVLPTHVAIDVLRQVATLCEESVGKANEFILHMESFRTEKGECHVGIHWNHGDWTEGRIGQVPSIFYKHAVEMVISRHSWFSGKNTQLSVEDDDLLLFENEYISCLSHNIKVVHCAVDMRDDSEALRIICPSDCCTYGNDFDFFKQNTDDADQFIGPDIRFTKSSFEEACLRRAQNKECHFGYPF